MGKKILALVLFLVCLFSCSKKLNNKTAGTIIHEQKAEDKSVEYVYVNSVDGLRVRKNATSESEKIDFKKIKKR